MVNWQRTTVRIARSFNRDQHLTQTSQEKYDPWDGRGRFRKLELGHQELKARLPDHLTLTPLHTEDIIYDKTKNSRNYVLIHALHSLITIALYREYMAFAPWWTNMPVGPLDEPKIVDSPPTKDYWINQARLCFGAAKDFADLLRACRGAGALVDSTIAGWATYIVGWCGEFSSTSFLLLRDTKVLQLCTATYSQTWILIVRWIPEHNSQRGTSQMKYLTIWVIDLSCHGNGLTILHNYISIFAARKLDGGVCRGGQMARLVAHRATTVEEASRSTNLKVSKVLTCSWAVILTRVGDATPTGTTGSSPTMPRRRNHNSKARAHLLPRPDRSQDSLQ
jgi:hypothetical protein